MEPKQIFRQGQDIYTIENNAARKLGSTEFNRDYAPNASAITDLGQREDLFNQYFPKPTAINPSEIAGDNNNLTDGSGGIRDSVNEINNLGTETENKTTAMPETGSLESILQGIKDSFNSATTSIDSLKTSWEATKALSADDLSEVEEAGKTAGGVYDPLIEEAQIAKKQGMAKGLVGAGERGGLMNTQFAGQSALFTTEGGTFVGTGGQLNQLKSEYDANINKLQTAKEQAIAAAKQATKTAIRTGKQQDFQVATDLFKMAQEAHSTALNEAAALQNIITGYNAEQRAGAAEKRAQAGFGLDQAAKMFSIIKDIPEGKTQTINGITFTGIGQSDVDAFFKGSDIISIAKSLPMGVSQELTDPNTGRTYTITGLATEDPNVKSVQSYDDSGRLTITSYRLNNDGTMALLSQADGGQVGKSKTAAASTTVIMNQARSDALEDARQQLEKIGRGKDNKWSSGAVADAFTDYIVKNPGRAKDFQDMVRANANLDDSEIKAILNLNLNKSSGKIKYTSKSGQTYEIGE